MEGDDWRLMDLGGEVVSELGEGLGLSLEASPPDSNPVVVVGRSDDVAFA